jgi:hypothetical protein
VPSSALDRQPLAVFDAQVRSCDGRNGASAPADEMEIGAACPETVFAPTVADIFGATPVIRLRANPRPISAAAPVIISSRKKCA